MTPTRRTKIKALANDERGDSQMRAMAQRLLDRFPEPKPEPKLGRVAGIERTSEYVKFIFMDANNWKRRTRDGPLRHTSVYQGRVYIFTIFKISNGYWRWSRKHGDKEISSVSKNLREALETAWASMEEG
jgi:hypothetical protein